MSTGKMRPEAKNHQKLKMDWRAILVICALTAMAGGVLYLPFFIWFRVRGRKSKNAGANSVRYTTAGWCLIGFMLTVLFGGLAVGQFAPASWFGAQVGTLLGGIGYFFVVWMASTAIEWCFRRLGISFVRQLPSKHDGTFRPEAVSPP
ncbi:hypothetical protein [Variovorax paradoxus]|uniref:hypothetical protein n=1 Tax=Variovorax paradoxus TaxID=34073 RepID=UPI003D64F311